MGLKVFATPDPTIDNLNGDGLADAYDNADADAVNNGFSRAKGFTSVADLLGKIDAILQANPNDCLELIGVWAHGNPTVCDGIRRADLAAIGAKLQVWSAAARLCDEVDIFLNGCNTGVWFRSRESIAQQLSRNTPTEAADRVRVTVHGSVGYLRGTNMQGNASTSTDATVKHGGVKDYFAPYSPVTDSSGTVHPGSTAANGAASFVSFREGAQI